MAHDLNPNKRNVSPERVVITEEQVIEFEVNGLDGKVPTMVTTMTTEAIPLAGTLSRAITMLNEQTIGVAGELLQEQQVFSGQSTVSEEVTSDTREPGYFLFSFFDCMCLFFLSPHRERWKMEIL